MSKAIGLIAEDESDIQVLKSIIGHISRNRKFKYGRFVGHGAGKIKGKCHQWAKALSQMGCRYLILMQDLDSGCVADLKREIQDALRPCPISKNVIVIPVRMIEAWLLSDTYAIKVALGLPNPINDIPNPESLVDPKAKLRDLIYMRSGGKKKYVNTIDNPKIAKELRIQKLRRCTSFHPLDLFVNHVIS